MVDCESKHGVKGEAKVDRHLSGVVRRQGDVIQAWSWCDLVEKVSLVCI